MSHSVRWVAVPGYVEIMLAGPIDLAGGEAALRAVADVAREHPGAPILADTRTAEYDLAATEVFQLVTEAAETPLARVRWAIVNRPQHDFDRGALFRELSVHRGMEVGVFRDPDQARVWLLG